MCLRRQWYGWASLCMCTKVIEVRISSKVVSVDFAVLALLPKAVK